MDEKKLIAALTEKLNKAIELEKQKLRQQYEVDAEALDALRVLKRYFAL
jgi:hypothetical protein